MSLSVVILAAGKGTRMKSQVPKVLHKLAHKPLLEHVYDTAIQLGAEQVVVVYGHGGEDVKEACAHFKADWVEQEEQLGTGHAVMQALPVLNLDNEILVLYGDVPLTSVNTLSNLLNLNNDELSLLTVILDEPTGYGRIIRNESGKVISIVEQKDANQDQLAICEVNTGILSCNGHKLQRLLNQIDNNNSQSEYYLTDIFKLAAGQGIPINTSNTENKYEVEGINDRLQLAKLERIHQKNIAEKLMQSGVSIADPSRLDIRGDVEIENDVFIDVNVILQGKVKLGSGTIIGANSIISDSDIAANVKIKPNCIIENVTVHSNCEIGPFARLRPETILSEGAKVGNFVEVKKSNIGKGSKINHLSYIGDTEMGEDVNVGAGTITCNYDGANKHKTIIGDKVFIGSDTQLVAPVIIAEGATIGAGATITKDVEADKLVISRAPQKSINGWKRPEKNK